MSVSSKYAAGNRALGICDRCGFEYLLHELFTEYYDLRPNGLRVCFTCLDVDHPQLQLGEIIISDPQSLYDPRPDVNIPGSTGYFGWRPLGHPVTGQLTGSVGTLTVTVT